MTDDQENKRSMARATITVLDDNNTIWSGLTGPSLIIGNVKDTMTLIDSNAVRQAGTTTGITEARKNAREILTKRAVMVAGGGYAYANVTEDPALAAKFDYKKTDLTQARDTVVTDIATIILDAANDNAAALVDYNIDGTDLTDLQAAITTYDGLDSGRDAVVTRSLATTALGILFPRLMEILTKQLDPVMETFKEDEYGFYITYKNARKIVNHRGSGGGTDAPEGGGDPEILTPAEG